MNEDGIIEILTDIGMARIQVIDSTGSISGNGEIIIRKLDTNNDEFLVTAWNGSDVNIMLPEGRYSAILESENIQGETEFEIFGDETRMGKSLGSDILSNKNTAVAIESRKCLQSEWNKIVKEFDGKNCKDCQTVSTKRRRLRGLFLRLQ